MGIWDIAKKNYFLPFDDLKPIKEIKKSKYYAKYKEYWHNKLNKYNYD